MSGVPYWGDAPSLWDTVKIGPYTLPGTASVKGDVTRRVQTDNVPGDDGTRSTDLGYGGAQVTITVQLWNQGHLDAYTAIAQYIRPKQGDTPEALDVVHPALAVVGIRSLLVFRVGVPERSQTSGVYEAQIELEEFVPEKKGAVKTVNSSVSTELNQNAIKNKFGNTAQTLPPPSTAPPGPKGK